MGVLWSSKELFFSVVSILWFGCEESKLVSRSRPASEVEEVPGYEVTETLEPDQAKSVNIGTSKLVFETGSVIETSKVTLRRLDSPLEIDGVNFGDPAGDVVQVAIYDPTSGKVLGSNDLLKSFEFRQQVRSTDNFDQLGLLVVTDPGTSSQAVTLLPNGEIQFLDEGQFGLTASAVISLKLKVTNAVIWAVNYTESAGSAVTIGTSKGIKSTGGSVFTSGSASGSAGNGGSAANNNVKKLGLIYANQRAGKSVFVLLTKNSLEPGTWNAPVEFGGHFLPSGVSGILIPAVSRSDDGRVAYAGYAEQANQVRFGYVEESEYSVVDSGSDKLSRPSLGFVGNTPHLSFLIDDNNLGPILRSYSHINGWQRSSGNDRQVTVDQLSNFSLMLGNERSATLLSSDGNWKTYWSNDDAYFFSFDQSSNQAASQTNWLSICATNADTVDELQRPYMQVDSLRRVLATHTCTIDNEIGDSRLILSNGTPSGSFDLVREYTDGNLTIVDSRAAYRSNGNAFVVYELRSNSPLQFLEFALIEKVGGTWQAAGTISGTQGFNIISAHFDANDRLVVIADNGGSGSSRKIFEIYKDGNGTWQKDVIVDETGSYDSEMFQGGAHVTFF